MTDSVSLAVRLVVLVPFVASILGLLVARRRAASAFIASAGAVVSLLAGCRTATDVQRDYAQTLRPREVEAAPVAGPDAPLPGPARILRVRIYADADYQAQTLRWRDRVLGQLGRANKVLEAQFRVRLEAEPVRAWSRPDRAGGLDKALADLAATDPARDVDWVIGLVSSLPIFSESHEQLGMAYFFGRHFVLRGMDSLAEAEQLERALDKLAADERESLLRERRLHKETAVLLHEWAHTLGAFHERSPDWLMAPAYEVRQAAFSPESSRIVLVGLRLRNASDAHGREAWGRAYRDEVVRSAATAWDERTRQEALALARQLGGTAADGAPGGATPPTAAAPLLGARPEELLALARERLDARDRPGAIEALLRAEAGLASAGSDGRTWVRLAQLFDRAQTCTAAERAAARAPGVPAAEDVVAECTRLRRWYALPRAARGIPVEREHEYVAAIRAAETEVHRERFDRAKARARELEKAFPGSPGAALIACLADDERKVAARTKVSCAAAARADPEAFHPQHILGRIAFEERRWKEARALLQRALELDEANGEVWQEVADAHQRFGDTDALEETRARYRTRFGLELRPAR